MFDEEEDEEESVLAMGSPKLVEMGVDLERVKPNVGAKEVIPKPVETDASAEDIAGD